jgi:hypothetical protein
VNGAEPAGAAGAPAAAADGSLTPQSELEEDAAKKLSQLTCVAPQHPRELATAIRALHAPRCRRVRLSPAAQLHAHAVAICIRVVAPCRALER